LNIDKLTLFLFSVIGISLLFIYIIIGTILGMFFGWVLSITPLGIYVENGLSYLNFNAKGHLIEIGAAVGFVSGFFKGSSSKSD